MKTVEMAIPYESMLLLVGWASKLNPIDRLRYE